MIPAHGSRTFAVAVLSVGFRASLAQSSIPGGHVSIQFEHIGGPDNMLQDLLQQGLTLPQGLPLPGPNMMHAIQELPMDALKGLFPGPLVFQTGPTAVSDIFGNGAPDPIILDMLGETHAGFQNDVVPMVHDAQSASVASPKICHPDVLKHCGKSRSQLQCLGAHQDDISKECRDVVSKSVPYLCSSSIDKHCDSLHGAILPCLEAHMADMDENCKNAVNVTRGVITAANTHKVNVVNTTSGAKTSVTPSQEALEAALADAVRKMLGRTSAEQSGIVKYLLWWAVPLSCVAYALHAAYPEWLSSWRLVRQLSGNSKGEARNLLVCTQPLKPTADWKV